MIEKEENLFQEISFWYYCAEKPDITEEFSFFYIIRPQKIKLECGIYKYYAGYAHKGGSHYSNIIGIIWKKSIDWLP